MKILSMSLPMLIFVTALSIAVTALQDDAMTDAIYTEQITTAHDNLKIDLESLGSICQADVTACAEQTALRRAISMKDSADIEEALSAVSGELDYFTVTDNNGSSLYSTDEACGEGTDLSQLSYFSKALSGEDAQGVYADGDDVRIVSAVAIRDDNGNTLGILAGGKSYANNELLDELKTVHGVEFTVFFGDVRAATTIMKDGERVTGTTLDPTIADIVLNKKQDYNGTAQILGNPYLTAYSPIIDADGNAAGVLFAGLPMAHNYQMRSASLWTSIIIMVVVIAVANTSFLMFIRYRVRKPMNQITDGARQLATGHTDFSMDIRQNDELGEMADAFNNVRDAIKAMLADAAMLTEAARDGQLSMRADETRHQGDYEQIIRGVNEILDAVIKPVQEASAVLEELAKGNLSVSVTGVYKGDHARINEALNDTINALKGYIGDISRALGEIAGGNLDVGITAEYHGDFVELKHSINGIVASLNEVLHEIESAADQVANGTQQVFLGSQEISQGAAEQTGAIEQLRNAVCDIAVQTQQNAQDAGKANELTREAAGSASAGSRQMLAMQLAMGEINQASRDISKVIKAIDDIAFQTNILALNAAVEAARAGEHGKGFAVVADEVRNLAACSANAAKETTEMIESSIKKTEAGTSISNETSSALTDIVDGVEGVAQLVDKISSASNEQASAITQINGSIDQMAQVIQMNSATAQEAAATAEELSSQADALKKLIGKFNLKRAGL